jgi:hypothetical protein
LELMSSFSYEFPDLIENFFQELNRNDALTSLDLSENNMRKANVKWEKLQISNTTIELFNILGKRFLVKFLRMWD